ncbi:hypothetical protein HMPREF9151_01932 [Hoylesella saccharolytica F0055]|uniref:Uncharacterized protein n=1 Tax=Hoylesella saccharolytica F0055 TaxID=1127699 RepID=L1N5E0_9BACT|nr:hypothetical protein HMPREF9151_01932 [Hoylesella saccharolytica F0055]
MLPQNKRGKTEFGYKNSKIVRIGNIFYRLLATFARKYLLIVRRCKLTVEYITNAW